jgi:hypothetical protein
MEQRRKPSPYARTLRAGITVGVLGALAMIFSNLFLQNLGVVSFNGPTHSLWSSRRCTCSLPWRACPSQLPLSQRRWSCAISTPRPRVQWACREPAGVDALVMSKLPNIICPVLALVLAGCAGSPSDSFRRTSSSDNSWNVGATHPRYDTLSPCDKDSSVERAVVSNDLPVSQLGMRLVPESTEKDAVRIAECLAKTLTGGEIWISSPRIDELPCGSEAAPVGVHRPTLTGAPSCEGASSRGI